MISLVERELLVASERTGVAVRLEVSGCYFCCCGRGFARRDGPQRYTVVVRDLSERELMAVAPGDGGASFWLLVNVSEITGVELVN